MIIVKYIYMSEETGGERRSESRKGSPLTCSGKVDQLLEVVDVVVDGLPTLVVSSRYERCERDSSFVLWTELLLEVFEEGPQRGEGERAKLLFGGEEALGEDSGTSGLHV